MEENKEVIQQQAEKVEKETITLTKEEVENLINKKAVEIFGEYLKDINQPKEEPQKEEPKEETIEDYLF